MSVPITRSDEPSLKKVRNGFLVVEQVPTGASLTALNCFDSQEDAQQFAAARMATQRTGQVYVLPVAFGLYYQ